MGRHEEFIYSSKYTPEELAKAFLKDEKLNELNDNSIDVICKATTKRDINISEIKIGKEIEKIKPIKIDKGIEGLVVSCPNFMDATKMLPILMKMKCHSVRPETIFWNADKSVEGLSYSDYFSDSSVEVNGKKCFAALKGSSISEQVKKAKNDEIQMNKNKSIPKIEKGVER